jgi:hypothetical protein
VIVEIRIDKFNCFFIFSHLKDRLRGIDPPSWKAVCPFFSAIFLSRDEIHAYLAGQIWGGFANLAGSARDLMAVHAVRHSAM